MPVHRLQVITGYGNGLFLALAQRTKWIKAGRTPQRTSISWGVDWSAFFVIEIETCERCGGTLKTIAATEGRDAIEKIQENLGIAVEPPESALQTGRRVPVFGRGTRLSRG